MTYDYIAGTSEIFLNGQPIATGSASVPLASISDVNVWLGKSQWNDPYFNGQFDEFRIYQGGLSEQEINSSYVAGPDALFNGLPTLTVQPTNGVLRLTWPLNAPGFTLERAGSPGAGTWTTVTNAPVLQSGQHVVSVTKSNATEFFRLRR